MTKILFRKPNFKFPKPRISTILILLAFTQVPFALNESLKLVCIGTTWADYAVFWEWKDIPLDSRVRYCLGGNIFSGGVKTDSATKKEDISPKSPL